MELKRIVITPTSTGVAVDAVYLEDGKLKRKDITNLLPPELVEAAMGLLLEGEELARQHPPERASTVRP